MFFSGLPTFRCITDPALLSTVFILHSSILHSSIPLFLFFYTLFSFLSFLFFPPLFPKQGNNSLGCLFFFFLFVFLYHWKKVGPLPGKPSSLFLSLSFFLASRKVSGHGE
ncbi:hypothetical protein GQ42DRAFT_27747 [Ramicandelaber brevisporus]|nr:hypothetical protein GQ42DRAFT_27747 [Ramicandelaber brevisporus]